MNGTGHTRRCLMALLLAAGSGVAQAHGFDAGDLRIEHPYSLPTPPGAKTGAVYLRAIRNNGREADRLLGAATAVAASVELHRSTIDKEIMRMRPVPTIDLPAGAEVLLRHGAGQGHHIMLVGLKAPLVAGDRFQVTLRFERAGEREVTVNVQLPRDPKAEAQEHRH